MLSFLILPIISQNISITQTYQYGLFKPSDILNVHSNSDQIVYIFLESVSSMIVHCQNKTYINDADKNYFIFSGFDFYGQEFYIDSFEVNSQNSIFFEAWIIPKNRCSSSIALTGWPRIQYTYEHDLYQVETGCIFAPAKSIDFPTDFTYKFFNSGELIIYQNNSDTSTWKRNVKTQISNPFYVRIEATFLFYSFDFSFTSKNTSKNTHFNACSATEICIQKETGVFCPSSNPYSFPIRSYNIDCTDPSKEGLSVGALCAIIFSILIVLIIIFIIIYFNYRRKKEHNGVAQSSILLSDTPPVQYSSSTIHRHHILFLIYQTLIL